MSLTNRRLLQALATGVVLSSAYSVSAVAQEASASGEVRRIDAQAGKLTVKHGAIADLELPAMTLVYNVDAKLLTGLQPGDKIKFTAKRENGQYVITKVAK